MIANVKSLPSGGLSTVPRALKTWLPEDELRSAIFMGFITREDGHDELTISNVTDVEIRAYLTPLVAVVDPMTKQLDVVLNKLSWLYDTSDFSRAAETFVLQIGKVFIAAGFEMFLEAVKTDPAGNVSKRDHKYITQRFMGCQPFELKRLVQSDVCLDPDVKKRFSM